MSERLIVNFEPAEGAMVRVLGLVEGRGYALRGVSVHDCPEAMVMLLDVEPRNQSHRLEVLARQIGRLIDVHSVSLPASKGGRRQ